jgi:hypothetical protein
MANLARVTGWTGHLAPVLAALSAVLPLGAAVADRFRHPLLLAATVAVIGTASGLIWWLDYALRIRLTKESAEQQAAFERTPPALEF